uniref:SipA n=1 Tax=Siphoviridae sp. ctTwu10 TaxID=2825525 RepID=A0A8S5P675_9CAUD|nr:MAG TPA: SipA [Siphoviridae sp. ctTwu10]
MQLEMGDNSMSPKIKKGDVLIIDKDAPMESFDIALVSGKWENGDPFQVVRRVYSYNEYLALIADNKDDRTNIAYIGLATDFNILGKVVEIRKEA